MMKAVAEMIEDGKRNGVNNTNSAWLRAIQASGLSLKSVTDKCDSEVTLVDVISEALSAANARWVRALLKQGQSVETIAQTMGTRVKTVEQWLSENNEDVE